MRIIRIDYKFQINSDIYTRIDIRYLPSETTLRRAERSLGYLATGLQKLWFLPPQSSTIRSRWWTVTVAATVSPSSSTYLYIDVFKNSKFKKNKNKKSKM